ncbi:hypothetical protein LM597_00360 [Candidatus Acetothermia bacterium]|nr:hypothetical protein [Candidatus Acetothermia bacterium]
MVLTLSRSWQHRTDTVIVGSLWRNGCVMMYRAGHTVVRAKELNAERVTQLGVVNNTDIYRIMYYTLFGRWLGESR